MKVIKITLSSLFLFLLSTFLIGNRPGFVSHAIAAGVCDIDNDCNIDKDDISLITSARNKPASGPDDPRDPDRDGVITVLDGRKCVLQCTQPYCAIVAPSCISGDLDHDGYTTAQGDCNDNDPLRNPGASDASCNGIDENCSGTADEGYILTATSCGSDSCTAAGQMSCVNGLENDSCVIPASSIWYADTDSDGYSSGVSLTQCSQPAGYFLASTLTSTTGDCNDNDPLRNPGASDVSCNGVDENCSGTADEGYILTATSCGSDSCTATGQMSCVNGLESDSCVVPASSIWYADTDSDGYSSGVSLTQCAQPAGYFLASTLTATTGDCNDNDPLRNPGASDTSCNGIDENCTGVPDEGYLLTPTTCGLGVCSVNIGQMACQNGQTVNMCDPFAGASTEICDQLDNDCDGQTDEGCPGHENNAPVLGAIGALNAVEGQLFSLTLNATDPDGDILIYSVTGLPLSASLNPSTGAFSWMPGYNQSGSYPLTFSVSDGSLTDSEEVVINVANSNRPPVLNHIVNITVIEGEEVTFTPTATDPDSDALTFSYSGWMTTSGYTTNINDSGTHVVTVTVSDGSLTDFQDVTVIVNNLNRPPVLDPIGGKTAVEGQALSFILTATDPEGDNLTYSAAGLPAGAMLNPNTGAFSWTPSFNISRLNAQNSYIIAFQVSDGVLSDSEGVTIDVTDVNRPPVITTTSLPNGRIDQPYSTAVSANDPDGDRLVFAINGGPSGLVIDQSSGLLSGWKPVSSDIGESHSLEVSVNDGRNGSDSRSYIITVPDSIAPTLLLNAPEEAIPGSTFTVTAEAADNVGVTEVRISAGNDSTSFPVQPYQRSVTIGAFETIGSNISLTGMAKDAAGNTTPASAMVRVAGVPDIAPPVVTLSAPPQVTSGSTITLSANASDDIGVESLSFYADNVLIGTVPPTTPGISFNVPSDAAEGSVIIFSVVASDFSGNTARAEKSSTVVTVSDTTPPEVSLQNQPEVEIGKTFDAAIFVADDTGVARTEIFVDHRLVLTRLSGMDETVNLTLPPGVVPALEAIIEVIATDFSGNTANTSGMVRVLAATQGLVTGSIYDSSNGRPVADALVQLVIQGRPVQETVSDLRGRYSFTTEEGSGGILVTRAGYSKVERPMVSIQNNKGRRVIDARLTPLAAATNIKSILGGNIESLFTASGGGLSSAIPAARRILPQTSATLTVPAGALPSDTSLVLSQIGAQGLEGHLPIGWSPAGAFDLLPRGISFSTQAGIRIPNWLGIAADTLLPLALWDETENAWFAAGTAQVLPDGSAIDAELSSTGQFAILIGDIVPAAPEIPVTGERLSGAASGQVPVEASGLVVPEPKILFYSPDAKSEVGLRLSSSVPVPSGTNVWANIAEHYSFYNDQTIVPEPFVQDITLYSFGRQDGNAAADFFVSPTADFGTNVLEIGVITVTAAVPPEDADTIPVVGPGGGIVSAITGESVSLPAGSVNGFIPVTITKFNISEIGLTPPAEFFSLGGAAIGFGGNELTQPAAVSIPVPDGYTEGGTLILVRVIEVNGSTRFSFAGIASASEGRIVSLADLLGDGSVLSMGVVTSGRYLFLKTSQALSFAGGIVTGVDGLPFDGALVSGNYLPLVTLSGKDGSYTTVISPGAFTLTALDTIRMNTGSVSGTVNEGGFAPADISMSIAPPNVLSVTPAGGAVNVALADPVRVTFSEPIDPADLLPSNFTITANTGIVTCSLVLSEGNTVVTLRHEQVFDPNTIYTLTITNVHDLAGYVMTSPFTAQFTSLDIIPPPPPPSGSVTATLPGAEGTTTITGTQGSAGLHDTVFLINLTTGARNQVQVNTNGGFSAILQSDIRDRFQLEITNPAGVTTIVDLPRFQQTNPDGSVSAVVGAEGGWVEGPGGVAAEVPAGAFPDGAVVTVNLVDEANFPIQLTEEQKMAFTFSGGIQIDFGGKIPADGKYINLSIPAQPEDMIELSHPFYGYQGDENQWLVSQAVNAEGGIRLNSIDTARIINGRITTSSPPCPGATGNGVYGFFKARDVMGLVYGDVDMAHFAMAQIGAIAIGMLPIHGLPGFAMFAYHMYEFAAIAADLAVQLVPKRVCLPTLSGRVTAVPNNVDITIDISLLTSADRQITIRNTVRGTVFVYSRNLLEAKYKYGDTYKFSVEGSNEDNYVAEVSNNLGSTTTSTCAPTFPGLCTVQPFSLVRVTIPAVNLFFPDDAADRVVDVRGDIVVKNNTRGTEVRLPHRCRYPNNPPVAGVTAMCDFPDLSLTIDGEVSDSILVDILVDVTYRNQVTGVISTSPVPQRNVSPVVSAYGPSGTVGMPPGNLLIKAMNGSIDPTRVQIEQHNTLYPSRKVDGFGVTGVFITNKTQGGTVNLIQGSGTCTIASCPVPASATCTGDNCYAVPLNMIQNGGFTYPVEGNLGVLPDDIDLLIVYEDGKTDTIPLPNFNITVRNINTNQVIRTVTSQAPPKGRPFNIGIVTSVTAGGALTVVPPTSLTLDPQSSITLTFSNPVNPDSVQNGFDVMDSYGNRVTGTFRFLEGYTVVEFIPNAPFRMGEVYHLSLSAIEDMLGNNLAFSTTQFNVSQPVLMGSLDHGMSRPKLEPIVDVDILRKNISGIPHTYAFAVTDSLPGYSILGIDITDPTNPAEISNIYSGVGRQKRVAVVPDAAFFIRTNTGPNGLCHMSSGVSLFEGDLAVATAGNVDSLFGQINRIRLYDLSSSVSATSPPGLCTLNGKLLTVDPSAGNSPSWEGALRVVGYVQGVATLKHDTGFAAYAAVGEVGLMAIDIGKNIPPYTLPERGEQEGLYSGDYRDVAVVGNPMSAVNLTSIHVSPEKVTIDKCSTSSQVQQYTTIGINNNGSTEVLTDAAWTSGNTAVGSINTSGLATAGTPGEAEIYASKGSINSNHVTFKVKQLTSISVGPNLETLLKGKTLQYWAIGYYNDGSLADITKTVIWTSSDMTVAAINASGVASGVSWGQSNITATACGITGTASLTVKQLISIAVTPVNITLLVGETNSIFALGTYSDGSLTDLSQTATWSSSDTTVSTIDASGKITALGLGTSYITALYDGIVSNTATINVLTVIVLPGPMVMINEVVVEPQQDWNDTSGGDGIPFNDVPGSAVPNSGDQWIELYNIGAPADLTGWTLDFMNTSAVLITIPVGAVTLNPGDRHIVVSPGVFNLDSILTLRDSSGLERDAVDLSAVHALFGHATGVGNEALERLPDGIDTDQVSDFKRRAATINTFNQ